MNPVSIFYEKRKNKELFESFKQYGLENPQNYIPIYKKFFLLNETNFNSINLNHPLYISKINKELDANIYECSVERNDESQSHSHKKTNKHIFFKMAPLLDPFKCMVGKYNITDENLLKLPCLEKQPTSTSIKTNYDVIGKMYDENNCAYVDSLFSFLSSQLLHKHKFLHGLDYYGSFLTIKNNFKINIYDDVDYLKKSDYFNKNKNILFQVDDYSHLLDDEDLIDRKPPITILDVDVDVDVDVDETDDDNIPDLVPIVEESENDKAPPINETITECNLKEMEWTNDLWEKSQHNLISTNTSLSSGSSCSSRTSYTDTDNDTERENELNDEEHDDNMTQDSHSHSSCSTCKSDEDFSDTETEDESPIYATLPAFPVQIICLEKCENTLDDFILSNENIKDVEWFSALFQIIMTLLTYQKVFSFTHNDLHTNNIMYVKTNKPYLYYCYKNKYYRVPTFGRLFKIIDFGRGIYRLGDKLCCSNSFDNGEDAHTQYNTEPYFNDKKARIEPNYSFDLCRLACSIFDYVVEDMDSIKNLKKCDSITRLIVEWCLDDNGVNVLYKNDGSERYPDFKLYKMIARNVHNHTPEAQLERKEFKSFLIQKNKIPEIEKECVMNLDNMF